MSIQSSGLFYSLNNLEKVPDSSDDDVSDNDDDKDSDQYTFYRIESY